MATSAFIRQDTSMCTHLREYLSISSESTTNVKLELNEDGSVVTDPVKDSSGDSRRSDAEKRFVEVIQWGARKEGVKRRKVCAPQCQTCHSTLSRPWACLTCPFIGCTSMFASSSTSKRCFENHWEGSKESCSYAIDSTTGTIYCATCQDATYPDTFETLFRATRTKVEESNDSSREQSVIGKGRARGAFKPWIPPKIEDVVPASCRGLRPLLNLSQTCFLSAILQALIHNPLLKAYFLSDKHNRHVCSNGSKGLSVGRPYVGPQGVVSDERDKGCMCCEMDRAFEEFHSDDKSPYGPITMLYSMWHTSAELEGYGQQDAHAFFLAALDQIHAHAKGQLSSCNCIAHQTFAGSLLSTVTCSRCETTSTTIDPILDLQLDFPSEAADSKPLTLVNMLRRFCADEKVGDAAKGYDCSKCGGGPGTIATRRLQIKKLPQVLSFQLKRFAHNATSTKVELPVKFPSHLDMRQFVETPAAGSKPLPSTMYEYDLFAVVTHEGKLDNGHYWADVLSGDQWWHCDDDKVTPTTLRDVLNQRAYILFYVKRSLAYAQPPARLLGSTNGTANGTTGGVNVNGSAVTTSKDVIPPSKPNPPSPQTPSARPHNPIAGRGGHPITGMLV